MRLYELAYCCRIYAHMTEYDVALERLRDKTGDRIDLTQAEHRTGVLRWLNAWGCRHLALQDHAMAAAALEEWFTDWKESLPVPGHPVTTLTETDLIAV